MAVPTRIPKTQLDTTLVDTTTTQSVSGKNFATGNTFPTFNQSTTGSAASLTTARTLAGNSFNGTANVPFTNKFIVQGTTDAGLTGAQFLGALSTGLLKNTTTTGVLSVAAAGTDYLTPTGTETVTNHDVKSATNTFASVTNVTSSATPTPTGDSRQNDLNVTAQTVGATIGAPTGTPVNGNRVLMRIFSAAAQTLAFNAIYNFSTDQPAPTSTGVGKDLYIGAVYNSRSSKWDAVLVLGNF